MNLTLEQVAERLGVCRQSVVRRIREGELAAMKLSPRCYRVEESDLQAYINRAKKLCGKKGE